MTDACIPDLVRLGGLRRLAVYDSKITEQGAARLREALPGCEVVWSVQRESNDAAAGIEPL